jgi:hypothetical protein
MEGKMKPNYIWIIEIEWYGDWQPTGQHFYSREQARKVLHVWKKRPFPLYRIRKYVAVEK